MKQELRPSALDQLTFREQEVLGLLRTGLTDRQIAQRLGLSRRTISHHVSEIIGKLGVRNRREAAAWPERPPWWLCGTVSVGMVWRKTAAAGASQAGSLASAASIGLVLATVGGLALLGVLLASIDRRPGTPMASVLTQEPAGSTALPVTSSATLEGTAGPQDRPLHVRQTAGPQDRPLYVRQDDAARAPPGERPAESERALQAPLAPTPTPTATAPSPEVFPPPEVEPPPYVCIPEDCGVPFETIDLGRYFRDYCQDREFLDPAPSIPGGKPDFRVIRSQEALDALTNVRCSDASPPIANFEEEMILALGEQYPTGGYSLRFDLVTAGGDTWTAYATRTRPGPSCVVTQAFKTAQHVIKLQRTDLPVLLSLADHEVSCSGVGPFAGGGS
jgi:DNA-binding CsgD family transcriptional regulator